MGTQVLTESIGSFDRVDREAGIIRGCRILQAKSENGRRYLQEAMEESAPLYEGVRVYIDHLPKNAKSVQRSKRDRWGKLQDVEMQEGSLVGDLHYLKEHPMTAAILESIERFGDTGLSHHAEGKVERQDGELVVSKIMNVRSVDFVEAAATNANLFEGAEGTEEVPMSKVAVLTVLRESVSVPGVSRCLAQLADSGFESSSEIELTEGVTGEDRLPAALGGLVKEILESDGSAGLETVSALFAPEPAAEAAAVAGDESELATLREQVESLLAEKAQAEARAACIELLESAGVEVNDVRVNALAALPESSRADLVAEWPKAGRKPARSFGLSHASDLKESADELPKDFSLKSALGY
jgi:hypothetical protein